MVREEKQSIRTVAYRRNPCLTWSVLAFICLMSIGKNFVTVDLAVAMESFKDEEGVTEEQISLLFAGGYAFSIFGKVAGGIGSDTVGGKATCVLACVVYGGATLLFTVVPKGAPFPIYVFLWGVNVLCALGIMGVSRVAIAANWVPHDMTGKLMALVAMSTDIGDALSRVALAPFLAYGWKAVFRVGGVAAILSGVPLLFVGDAPRGNQDTIQFAKKMEDKKNEGKPQKSFFSQVKPLLTNVMLYAIVVLSCVLYGTRTLFLNYAASFLAEVRCRGSELGAACLVSDDTLSSTALASSTFTLFGCFSPLIVGSLKDALASRGLDKHRAVPLIIFLAPLVFTLFFLALANTYLPYYPAVVIMALAGAFLAGPFKIIGPVFAVDVAGKDAKGVVLSVVGMGNNIAAIVLILVKGVIGKDWSVMFSVLAAMSLLALGFAVYIWVLDLAAAKNKTLMEQKEAEQKAEALLPQDDVLRKAFVRRESFLENKNND